MLHLPWAVLEKFSSLSVSMFNAHEDIGIDWLCSLGLDREVCSILTLIIHFPESQLHFGQLAPGDDDALGVSIEGWDHWSAFL